MNAATSAPGLSIQDVESIRGVLAAGRRPKVMFTEAAGQIAGQLGQVVELTDPAAGEDYLVVRFGRDELPFSPTDLSIPPKSPPRKAARPAPEFKLNDPPAFEEKETMSTSALDEEQSSPDAPSSPTEPGPSAGDPAGAPPRAGAKATKAAAKAAKPKPTAGLTVTLAYAEGEWTVAAQQGSKVLAKPYVVKAAEAVKMVGMLDVSGVQEAVEQIVATERAEARNQAERLRAELAEVEAKLAELGESA
jgi:hypothetical protein